MEFTKEEALEKAWNMIHTRNFDITADGGVNFGCRSTDNEIDDAAEMIYEEIREFTKDDLKLHLSTWWHEQMFKETVDIDDFKDIFSHMANECLKELARDGKISEDIHEFVCFSLAPCRITK